MTQVGWRRHTDVKAQNDYFPVKQKQTKNTYRSVYFSGNTKILPLMSWKESKTKDKVPPILSSGTLTSCELCQ